MFSESSVSLDAADFLCMTEAEKAELERKRKEVAERRALETKEQERREAEKRLQGDQPK